MERVGSSRRMFIAAAIVALTAPLTFAQSPAATATATINGRSLAVRYAAEWELIVSKQTGQWGLSYDPKQDLGRVKMMMSKPPALVETLKYTIADKGKGQGELRLEWEHHVATVPIAVK